MSCPEIGECIGGEIGVAERAREKSAASYNGRANYALIEEAAPVNHRGIQFARWHGDRGLGAGGNGETGAQLPLCACLLLSCRTNGNVLSSLSVNQGIDISSILQE